VELVDEGQLVLDGADIGLWVTCGRPHHLGGMAGETIVTVEKSMPARTTTRRISTWVCTAMWC